MQGTHIMLKTHARTCWGAIQVLRNEDGVGGGVSDFPEKKLRRCKVRCYLRYEGVGGGSISWKKRDVRLEWPLRHMHMYDRHMHRHTQTLAYQHAVSQLGICQYISYFEKNPNPG